MLARAGMRGRSMTLWIVAAAACNSPSPPERGSIEVLMGNGDGSFATGWSTSAHLPRALAFADLDGDERAELAVAGYDNFVVTYAIGVAGGYDRRQEIEVDPWPSSIVALDINADGAHDLVVACDRKIDVLMSDGDGELLPPVSFPGGRNTALAILDFDRDSIMDLAVPRLNTVALLRGTENGQFEEFGYLTVQSELHDLKTADVNADGYSDVIATALTFGLLSADHGTVYVLLGGPMGFRPPVAYDTPNRGQGLTIGDLNNDMRPDLLVTGPTDTVAISLGAADGAFGPFTEHRVGAGAHSALVEDFNGDSLPDVAVTHTGGKVTISLAAAGGLAAPTVYDAGIVPWSLIATDIDDDGRMDLIVANEGGAGQPF
jgi:hypothetical protein